VLQPRGALAWQTASGDLSPSAQMAFLSAPNAGFTVGGAPLADNAALIEIGADLLISEQARLGLSYVGQYADGVSSYGLQAAITWTF
jgi:subtilase-type serine protease